MAQFVENSKYRLTRWKPIGIDDLIRLGGLEDGGYVISRRCVEKTRILLSLGISSEWSFEAEFLRLSKDTAVVGVDGSVSAGIFFSRAIEGIKRAFSAGINFQVGRVGTECRGALWWLKKALQFNKFYCRGSRHFHQVFIDSLQKAGAITWTELWRAEPVLTDVRSGSFDCFVKMDIEGAEYRVLADPSFDASKINGLVVEFHDCDIHWDVFSTIMDQLSREFAVVHIHGNNFRPLIPDSLTPSTLEVSFLNRRLLSECPTEVMDRYPRPSLDWPCNPTQPDYPIYF